MTLTLSTISATATYCALKSPEDRGMNGTGWYYEEELKTGRTSHLTTSI